MSFFRAIAISLFAIFSFVNFSVAYEINNASLGTIEKETYFFPNQIVIKDNGMFLVTEQGIGLITKLNWNEEGYFTGNVELKKCHNGPPQVCLDCHGCGNKTCIWRCNCYGGPRQD
jgi:hypothetical protein